MSENNASRPVKANAAGTVSRRHFLLSTTAVVAAAAVFSKSDASFAQTPPAAPKGQVVVGLTQEPTVFNPLMAGIEVDESVWMQVFSPLWMAGPEGELKPHLAKEIPTEANGGIAEGGLLWTIKLRDDIKWHDGKPFTAEDVKYSLELINAPNFRAGTRQGHELITEITVKGPHELTWRMSKPYAPYLALLCSTYIVPKHILSTAEDPNTALANAPVGTGPFIWSERVSGDSITLTANPDYFGDGPYLERVIFKYIPQATALYAQFRTGQVDITIGTGIPANNFKEASALPGFKVEAVPNASLEIIMPNLEHPALKDKVVRQALYAAVDSQSIIDAIYYGIHRPNVSFAPQESWAYNPDLKPHVFDIDAAAKILDEAGWKMGSGNVREKDGIKLEFAISTTTGNALREQAQQLMIQLWETIGIKVTADNKPAAVIWGDFYRQSQFQTLLVGTAFRTGTDPDPSNRFLSTAIPAQGGKGGNYMQWKNEEADKLLAEGTATFDQAKRKAIYGRLQEIVREELPILPIYQFAIIEGRKDTLMGYQPNINARQNTWNLSDWYWGTA